MIRVLLVDDQTLIRQGIAMLLELEPDLEVVGAVGDGRAAIEAVERLRPDVVLMDVRMPEMDGVTATRELHRRFPDVGVIILTTFDDDEYIFEGLKAGARGYLLKDISSEEMAEAVRTVARGEALIQPSIARKVVAEFSRLAAGSPPAPERSPLKMPGALTERELDVLKALARGMSNKEIAAALVITEGTVKTHISNILAKLDVRDRTQAVLKAQQLRLLESEN
ncbi:MAG: response regulator transcription factor [Roseiflexus sp.]|jgi:DNA-binding NarL/FixJ family response regulator|nr:response regulator transcription factor [Roseiflexus sp.]